MCIRDSYEYWSHQQTETVWGKNPQTLVNNTINSCSCRLNRTFPDEQLACVPTVTDHSQSWLVSLQHHEDLRGNPSYSISKFRTKRGNVKNGNGSGGFSLDFIGEGARQTRDITPQLVRVVCSSLSDWPGHMMRHSSTKLMCWKFGSGLLPSMSWRSGTEVVVDILCRVPPLLVLDRIFCFQFEAETWGSPRELLPWLLLLTACEYHCFDWVKYIYPDVLLHTTWTRSKSEVFCSYIFWQWHCD